MKDRSDIDLKDYITAYGKYYPYFLNILSSKLGNVDEAEDICQELFLEFYRNFDEIDEKSIRAWLFSGMRFMVKNYYRNKGTKNLQADNIEDYLENRKLSFINGERDNRIIIKEALDEKSGNFQSEEDKVIFDLLTIYKYTYKEVGEEMNLSVRQVIYRYQKTTERIITYLKRRGLKEIQEFYE